MRYIGHQGDGDTATILRFEVPTFGSAAPEFFEQQRFWKYGPEPEETAFELFAAALHDVAGRVVDSNAYDPGLLNRIAGYKAVVSRGVSRIEMPNNDAGKRAEIDDAVITAAAELATITPSPRRVRIAGRLDLMGATKGVLQIDVNAGETVTAIWERRDEPIEALKHVFNRDVVVEGLGIFRPSGTLLRIDADAIVPASIQDDFFRGVPVGASQPDYSKVTRVKPYERVGFQQLRGYLRFDDDSDEQFETAISEIR